MRERGTLSARNPLRPSWLRTTRVPDPPLSRLQNNGVDIHVSFIYTYSSILDCARFRISKERSGRIKEGDKERKRQRSEAIKSWEWKSIRRKADQAHLHRDDAKEPLIEEFSETETPLSHHCRNEYKRHYPYSKENIQQKMTIYTYILRKMYISLYHVFSRFPRCTYIGICIYSEQLYCVLKR